MRPARLAACSRSDAADPDRCDNIKEKAAAGEILLTKLACLLTLLSVFSRNLLKVVGFVMLPAARLPSSREAARLGATRPREDPS
jgi:hypothetical protein